MFWQLQGHVTSAVACDEERVSTVQWCQQHIYPNTHPSQSKRSGLQRISETCALYLHFRCKKTRRKKKTSKSQFLWRVSEHLVLTVHLSMWVLGNARTALTGRRVLGKGKKQKSGFFPGKQTDFCFRGEREDCLSDCLQWLGMEDETLSQTGKAVFN